MKKILLVIDFQNDFIDGSLGTKEAQAIIGNVVKKIESYEEKNRFATQDTHFEDYLSTQEGKNLPVLHCQKGTFGWEIRKEAQLGFAKIFEKNSFGSIELAQFVKAQDVDEVELIGICTDICVVSNALLIKAFAPEVKIKVDVSCCAGVTPESHLAAIETMKSCQIEMINE
ncbi:MULTISPECIES: cysteine hydrolase family protein [unclassified Lactococcus]|uniref:cysteine hydrolase family protein n=1 Tax=unclassified Lactococcus TaxID=2643510 RepID=UPI0011C71ABC|nr:MULTISPECIES: isochorismatase family cysteine hydrolase [unclassified Lactococcus]MQW23226.1 isochorismatase family protein [Lactococcus sp. dk101]TXK38105.1 cysteine hydrolase [Lactococcus sp. dk310]TXK49784.1 cysteine hydrolase [Lactococcus sp. dk322]